MEQWQYGVGNWRNSSPERSLGNLSSFSLKLDRDVPSTATFSFTGSVSRASKAIVRKYIDDIWIWKGPELIERFRVINSDFSCDATGYTQSISCVDYRQLLDRELLDPVLGVEGDVYIVPVSGADTEEVSAAVARIINYAQSRTNGNLGITISPTQWQTGYKYDIGSPQEFGELDTPWTAISKITENVATFRITPNKVAELWVPIKQSAEIETPLDWGGAVTTYAETQGTPYANVVRQTGDNVTGTPLYFYGPDGAEGTPSSAFTTLPSGRIETSKSDTRLKNLASVRRAGQNNIKLLSLEAPSYQLTLAPGHWRGREHIDIGNIVRVYFKPHGVEDSVAVTSIQISVDANNMETVAITAGRPRIETSRAIANLALRVRNLEGR